MAALGKVACREESVERGSRRKAQHSVVSEKFFASAGGVQGAAAFAAQELPKTAGDGTCSLTRGCIEIDAGVKRCRRKGHVKIAVNRAALG